MRTPRNQTRFRIGAWTVDPAANLLEQGRHSVRLESRAMDVLTCLASRGGAVTSVDELMSTVWKGVVVGDGSVYLAISQLRQALGELDGKSYIETVPRRGYLLTVPVEPAGPKPRRRWPMVATAASLALAVGLLAWSLRPPASVPSIAVLPFADLSPDGGQAYFSDGVTAEVLNRLAGIRGLRVIARTSSFQFRGQNTDAATVGEKLGVAHLLVGSVRKQGDRMRVTAQLTNARSGEQLWSQVYERRSDDIFAIQDEIAKSVANAMQVKLNVGETSRLPGMTRDVTAYDEYLRGMALNIQMRSEDFPAAIAHLQRAVAIDPSFSLAWSGLHTVFSNGSYAVPERASAWRQAAAEALARARELTPDAPHVLLELGIAAVRRGDWLAGAALFQRLDRSYTDAGMAAAEAAGPHGVLLLAVGRIDESVQLLESARAHDPLAPAYAGFLSQARAANRDYHGALAEIDRGLRLDGLRESLLNSGVSVALSEGDRGEIERRLAAITDDTPTSRVHRRMASLLGKPGDAIHEIRALLSTASDPERVALAVWAAYYQDSALALSILAEVIPKRGHPGVLWLPLFAGARGMPGFSELAHRLGMADYWRARKFADFCEPLGPRQIKCR